LKTNFKKTLQEILPDTDEKMLSGLMDALMELQVEVVRPPEAGLMMMTVRDSFDVPFHLGEVLVTRSEVRIGQATGYGCCTGDRPNSSLALASLEALQKIAGGESSIRPVIDRLSALAEQIARHRETAARLRTLTRVEFQSMAEE
jgi:phosphonate C-P lyase system protein PhnG